MTPIQWSFVFFAAVASGGVLMSILIAAKARIPKLISYGHGLAGLAALVFLFSVNLRGQDSTPVLAWWALGIFLAGFTGGLLLFRVIFKDRATLPLAAVHGSAGALGLYLLFRAAF